MSVPSARDIPPQYASFLADSLRRRRWAGARRSQRFATAGTRCRGQTELTAQEAQVAKLARDGLSNPEIGARLYISARTAEFLLSKVFTKLDITSRTQLDRVLA